MKKYKTNTGVYAESQLAIVVWKNQNGRSRFLETMTSENSTFPMAFPIELLQKNKSWSRATLVRQDEDLFLKIPETDRESPLIVPLTVAQSALGWEDFYIPTEYEV